MTYTLNVSEFEQYKKDIDKAFEEVVNETVSNIVTETADKFIKAVIQEKVDSIVSALDTKIETEKARMLTEGFDLFVNEMGIKLNPSSDYDTLAEKYDAKVAQINNLKKEIADLKFDKLVAETAERSKLNLVENEKYRSMVDLVVDRDAEYDIISSKLEKIVESVKGSSTNNTRLVENTQENSKETDNRWDKF